MITKIIRPVFDRYRADRSERLCALHIGKTAGTAFKAVVSEHNAANPQKAIEMFGHGMTLPRLSVCRPNASVVFFVRHPVSRFVSGFNSRLRMGKPRYYSPWTRGEEIAFTRFPSANALGEALYSDDRTVRRHAKQAMLAISHARAGLAFFLGGPDDLAASSERILFIGEQERFDADLRDFQMALGLVDTSAPVDEVAAHKSPIDADTHLSTTARENLTRWYRDDFLAYQWCLDHKAAINADASAKLPKSWR